MYVDRSLRFPGKRQPQEGLVRRMFFARAARALAGQAPSPIVNGERLTTIEMLKAVVYARAHGFLPPI